MTSQPLCFVRIGLDRPFEVSPDFGAPEAVVIEAGGEGLTRAEIFLEPNAARWLITEIEQALEDLGDPELRRRFHRAD